MNKHSIETNSAELSPRYSYPYSSSGLSIQSLLREKSYLQTKLKQVELELQEKQYYYQEIQLKSNQNRQLYKQIVQDFQEFKQKTHQIHQQKDSIIQKITLELQTSKTSEQQLISQLKTYEMNLLKLTQQNNRIKKELIQKNIFIECYLKKDKQLSSTQQKKRDHTSNKKKHHQKLFDSTTKDQGQNYPKPFQ